MVMTIKDTISFTASLSNPVGENFNIGRENEATVTIKDEEGKN